MIEGEKTGLFDVFPATPDYALLIKIVFVLAKYRLHELKKYVANHRMVQMYILRDR